MVDLRNQYLSIKAEIDEAIAAVIDSSAFIKGRFVSEFEEQLAAYLQVDHVIAVGNGTDALQIALMALEIGPGDEVIAPSFTFVATSEAASLLGAVPVFADIDPATFNVDPICIEPLLSDKTKAIVPVHLYGQPCEMDAIMAIAEKYGISVVEDNAQGIGSKYGNQFCGTIGDMGTLSFFPSKNLGCFGDGGAVITNDDHLARAARLIANHGSEKKYHNEVVGVNSRLDGIQAAILSVKLGHLDSFNKARSESADRYDALFSDCEFIVSPSKTTHGTHVFHQYTVRVTTERAGARDALSAYLRGEQIPHAVYYPIPVHALPVNVNGTHPTRAGDMTHTNVASDQVISLPMHTELTDSQIEYIADHVVRFLEKFDSVPA